MTNKEKATHIAAALNVTARDFAAVQEIIKAELNRLDAPKPKKWKPRSGFCTVETCWGPDGYRCSGREYPTQEEAERAAPLHRKLDRLVNWLMEHCKKEVEIAPVETIVGEFAIVFKGSAGVGNKLIASIKSGEVEL